MTKALSAAVRTIRTMRACGFLNVMVGLVKHERYRRLVRRCSLDKWHAAPLEWRPYAIEVVRVVRDLLRREGLATVVEVGCGIGTVLAAIRPTRGVGYDTDAAVIAAARETGWPYDFRVGSFADVAEGEIDVLIAVNFTHNIPPEELRRCFEQVLTANRVKYVVVDSVAYTYHHDYDAVLAGLCERVSTSEPFVSERRVLLYRVSSAGTAKGTNR